MNKEERESQENILRLSPVISKAYSLGKEKKVDEAFETLRPYLERDEVPTYFCKPTGWTIYRYIKEKLSLLLPSEATAIFGHYLNLCEQKPDTVHSYIMVLAVSYKKLHTQEFRFVDFCRSWGLDNFRDEDYVSTKTTNQDGKTITYHSLVVKVATLLYKDLKHLRSPNYASEFLPFFNMVLTKCPDYEFTPLYIANLHAWNEDKDTAITMFRKMLVNKQQWYLWKHLGDLLDNDLRLSCYCKTLTMTDKENYIGEIHLALSSMLLASNPGQAAYELQSYVTTYQKNGWRLRPEAYEIKKALGDAKPSDCGKSYHYGQNSIKAEAFVFEDFPEDEFVYTGTIVNHSGKQRACLNNRKKHIFVKVPMSPEFRKAGKGDVFLCRYNVRDRITTIFTIHPTGKKVNSETRVTTSSQGLFQGEAKTVEGKVRIRTDKPYAFLDNYFITPQLRQSSNLVDGQIIRANAIKQQDGRWRIVKFLS